MAWDRPLSLVVNAQILLNLTPKPKNLAPTFLVLAIPLIHSDRQTPQILYNLLIYMIFTR